MTLRQSAIRKNVRKKTGRSLAVKRSPTDRA